MIDGSFSYSVVFAILNATFSTEQLGKNGNVTDWLTAIGTMLSAFVAVGIAVYSLYLTRRNEQRHSLEYVFRLLNDNVHRNARRTIYNLYGEKDLRRRKKILWVMGVKVNIVLPQSTYTDFSGKYNVSGFVLPNAQSAYSIHAYYLGNGTYQFVQDSKSQL